MTLQSLFGRFRERLWVRPTIYGVAAGALVGLARLSDVLIPLPDVLPMVSPETTEKLLTVLASTMLAVASFAVASMLSAYSAATTGSSPRTFKLVLADDISQSALSSFVGAFIFAVIGVLASREAGLEATGQRALFAMTIAIFVWVIGTFVRWTDSIARLGRMGSNISRVEDAAQAALLEDCRAPGLGGVPLSAGVQPQGRPVGHPARIGYVRNIDMARLQALAEAADTTVSVAARPGAFVWPDRALIVVPKDVQIDEDALCEAFDIGAERSFARDPRYGMIVLGEIASRALSPGINDPGTAIGVIDTVHRLVWVRAEMMATTPEIRFDRVQVPRLSVEDLLADVFIPLAREGAGTVEVAERLQRALSALRDGCGDMETAQAAARLGVDALARARAALQHGADITRVEGAARGEGGLLSDRSKPHTAP